MSKKKLTLRSRGIINIFKNKLFIMGNKFKSIIGVFIFLVVQFPVFSQAGLSTSPPKLYFVLDRGVTQVQKVTVNNPIASEMEVGVSVGDWDYSAEEENRLGKGDLINTSCSSWYRIMPESYFTLKPSETRELNIEFHVPDTADMLIPVRTSMLYFTQLNPGVGRARVRLLRSHDPPPAHRPGRRLATTATHP